MGGITFDREGRTATWIHPSQPPASHHPIQTPDCPNTHLRSSPLPPPKWSSPSLEYAEPVAGPLPPPKPPQLLTAPATDAPQRPRPRPLRRPRCVENPVPANSLRDPVELSPGANRPRKAPNRPAPQKAAPNSSPPQTDGRATPKHPTSANTRCRNPQASASPPATVGGTATTSPPSVTATPSTPSSRTSAPRLWASK